MMHEETASDNSQVDMGRIEAIRNQTSDTRELVRKVATYLFMECAVYPSGNKIFNLIKQGSMVTINDELGRWWNILRKKMAAKVHAPDLPDTVTTKLGELGAEIWGLASGEAKALFEVERIRLEDLADSAARQLDDAKTEINTLQASLSAASEEIGSLRSYVSKTEEALTEARNSAVMLTNEVERRTAENRAMQDQLVKAQEDFSRELQSQRDAIAKVEQRAQDNERKLMLEVDRARQETARKATELAALKEASERAATGLQQQLTASQRQTAELQQQLAQANADKAVIEATLTSKIAAAESILSATQGLLDATRQSLAESHAREQRLNEQLASLRSIEALLQKREEEQARQEQTRTKAAKKDEKSAEQ